MWPRVASAPRSLRLSRRMSLIVEKVISLTVKEISLTVKKKIFEIIKKAPAPSIERASNWMIDYNPDTNEYKVRWMSSWECKAQLMSSALRRSVKDEGDEQAIQLFHSDPRRSARKQKVVF